MGEQGARRISIVLLVCGPVLLAVNHWNIVEEHKAYVWAILLGPAATFFGVAGVISPGVLLATGKYGKHLPIHLKVIAFTVLVAGFACSAVLALVVYRLG
jgi:hypothetical protein